MGTKFRVEFEIEIPVEATDTQVEAWLSFHLGEFCSLSGTNPLTHHDLEASNVLVWRQK